MNMDKTFLCKRTGMRVITNLSIRVIVLYNGRSQ